MLQHVKIILTALSVYFSCTCNVFSQTKVGLLAGGNFSTIFTYGNKDGDKVSSEGLMGFRSTFIYSTAIDNKEFDFMLGYESNNLNTSTEKNEISLNNQGICFSVELSEKLFSKNNTSMMFKIGPYFNYYFHANIDANGTYWTYETTFDSTGTPLVTLVEKDYKLSKSELNSYAEYALAIITEVELKYSLNKNLILFSRLSALFSVNKYVNLSDVQYNTMNSFGLSFGVYYVLSNKVKME